MRERPIIFSSEMVKALLAGRKTQIRRVVSIRNTDYYEDKSINYNNEITGIFPHKNQGLYWTFCLSWSVVGIEHSDATNIPCPYGQPGDRLWVRETLIRHKEAKDMPDTITYLSDLTPVIGQSAPRPPYLHRAVWEWGERRKLPSIFMPRWASRLDLEIVNVRPERLQDISEENAKAEGIKGHTEHGGGSHSNPITIYPAFPEKDGGFLSPRDAYEALWDSINAKRGYPWSDNPWVWVVEFEVLR
jgi:hypothetical protein